MAARGAAFRLHPRLRHQVELGEQGIGPLLHRQILQTQIEGAGFIPALLKAGADQLKGQKQGPLAFEMLKTSELLRLVMQPGTVFHHRLMTITAEAGVAVLAAKMTANRRQGALAQLRLLNRKSRIPHHGQATAVHLLAGGFARQQRFQRATHAHHRIRGHPKPLPAIPLRSKRIQTTGRLQRRLHQANGTGIAFRSAVVAFIPPLPDAVIRHPISTAEVKNQVLQKRRLGLIGHHHQPGAGELGELQYKQRRGIELQMPPGVIGHHRLTAGGVVFGVQCIEGILARLEALHLVGLAHH